MEHIYFDMLKLQINCELYEKIYIAPRNPHVLRDALGIIVWIHRHQCLVKHTSSMSELSKKREHQCLSCSRTAGTLFKVRCVIRTV